MSVDNKQHLKLSLLKSWAKLRMSWKKSDAYTKVCKWLLSWSRFQNCLQPVILP